MNDELEQLSRIGSGVNLDVKPKPPPEPFVPPPGTPSFDLADAAVPIQNKLDRACRARLRADPFLWTVMVEGTRVLIDLGKPFSVKLIAEEARHLYRTGRITNPTNSKYAWSNSYTAYLPPLIAYHWPAMLDLIIIKGRRP